ncbi:MAG: 3-deoxy-8-phosphooctulonate synthase [Rhodobacterales bacterium]|nr:MAG: 3-deoxy-8-phosphooctulonate synthase [Rhodobacterales bacterium]
MSGRVVSIGGTRVGGDAPLCLIAGPTQLETLDHALEIGEVLKAACAAAGVGFIFKSSFDKANRSSAGAPRGPGMEAGLEMLAGLKARLGVPVCTDIHLPEQAAPVADVADMLQIPAFLSRQTDILLAAGETGRAVNIKKGQFLAPWEMKRAARKVEATGNARVLLTERGSSFGYDTLVADMRALVLMGETGFPVVMDATHAARMPRVPGHVEAGDARMVPALARAAVAVGVAGVFLETDPDPDSAPSDGPGIVPLDDMAGLIAGLAALHDAARAQPWPTG